MKSLRVIVAFFLGMWIWIREGGSRRLYPALAGVLFLLFRWTPTRESAGWFDRFGRSNRNWIGLFGLKKSQIESNRLRWVAEPNQTKSHSQFNRSIWLFKPNIFLSVACERFSHTDRIDLVRFDPTSSTIWFGSIWPVRRFESNQCTSLMPRKLIIKSN